MGASSSVPASVNDSQHHSSRSISFFGVCCRFCHCLVRCSSCNFECSAARRDNFFLSKCLYSWILCVPLNTVGPRLSNHELHLQNGEHHIDFVCEYVVNVLMIFCLNFCRSLSRAYSLQLVSFGALEVRELYIFHYFYLCLFIDEKFGFF